MGEVDRVSDNALLEKAGAARFEVSADILW